MGLPRKPNRFLKPVRFKPYQLKQYLSVIPQEFI